MNTVMNQTAESAKTDFKKVYVVLPTTKNKRRLVASGAGIFSENDPMHRANAKKLYSYKLVDGTANAEIAAIYDSITERIQDVYKSGKYRSLLFATHMNVAIKYFTSLRTLNEGGNPLEPLITNYGKEQKELIAPATRLLETIDMYRQKTGMQVLVDNYTNYHYETLAVSENAKAQLEDGMELVFNGNDCENVPGVSFLSKWHTNPCKRTLKIFKKNVYDAENQLVTDDEGKAVQVPSSYVVLQPRDNKGELKNERAAFMTALWADVLNSLPDFKPSEEEQAALIEEEF